jgi:hypothetical protein
MRPRRFPIWWYIGHKLCTFLAMWFPLSPNGLKQVSTRASSPRSIVGCDKMNSEHIVRLTQAVQLYCTNTNTVSKRTKTRFHMTHSSRSSIGCVKHDLRSGGTFDTNCAPFLHRDYHYLQTDSNKLPLEPCHLGVSSSASKTIFEHIIRSTQTVKLCCTNTNTVSKQTGTRFHMIHSSRSSIGCVQDDFWSDGTLDTNCAPFLHRDYHYLQTDRNKIPHDPLTYEFHRVRPR